MGEGLAVFLPLAVSILLGVALIVVMARLADVAPRPGIVTGLLGTLLVGMALMSVTRHQVRQLYLEPVSSLGVPAVVPQWGNFALFVVLLIVALLLSRRSRLACSLSRLSALERNSLATRGVISHRPYWTQPP